MEDIKAIHSVPILKKQICVIHEPCLAYDTPFMALHEILFAKKELAEILTRFTLRVLRNAFKTNREMPS